MVTEADIVAVLKTVPDPELPISIVDLGLVHRIDVVDSRPAAADGRLTRPPMADSGPAARGASQNVETGSVIVAIELVPTFVGCFALPAIRADIIEKVSRMPGVASVTVDFVYDPPWTVDRISPAGRAQLAELGVTVPRQHSSLITLGLATRAAEPVACPFCGSEQTQLESSFGPTRCKMIYHCSACKSPFERMKAV